MHAIKQGLPPIARPDAQLFILGSLPGDASLAAATYYAHPTNQFWRLLGRALDEPLANLPYDDRLDRLAQRRVGLWDVIASASRTGSLDQAIRAQILNPLATLIEEYRHVRAIAFNGASAASAGRRLLSGALEVTLLDLPSSSAANTRPFDQKAAVWDELAKYAGPKPLPRA
ncbi:MAG: DNA-deoxyinosine glycosylase [Sphingomicrobium sp.]